MKIKSCFLSYLSFLLLLVSSIYSSNLKSKQNIHPNVGEITSEYHKMVKPFYQKEYFPEEVATLQEPPKPSIEMCKFFCLVSFHQG
jgi:hypothetical protein